MTPGLVHLVMMEGLQCSETTSAKKVITLNLLYCGLYSSSSYTAANSSCTYGHL